MIQYERIDIKIIKKSSKISITSIGCYQKKKKTKKEYSRNRYYKLKD